MTATSRESRDRIKVQLLTPVEVAELFGVHPRTVNNWGRLGLIPQVLTPTGRTRYRETDVRALLEGSASPPGTPLSDEDAGLGERDEP